MLDMVLNVIREQGVFVLAGLWLLGGLLSQFMASRRYRKLRGGIQSLAALQTPAAPAAGTRGQDRPIVRSEQAEKRRKAQLAKEQEAGGAAGLSEPLSAPLEKAPAKDGQTGADTRTAEEKPANAKTADGRNLAVLDKPQEAPDGEGGVDSQLLYLRQSLDRIAAGRDQRLEEDPPKRRRLTPAEEEIIVDILREYLS